MKLLIRTLLILPFVAARMLCGHAMRIYAVASWRARRVDLSGSVLIRGDRRSKIMLGKGVALGQGVVLALDTGNQLTSELSIGPGTAINEFANIRAAGGRIGIGSGCQIAQFVCIIAVNHSFDNVESIHTAPWDTSRSTVEIGDDVWIGAHAVILPGARIGKGAVIAAGAVVTGNIPEFAVAAGVPARFIRYRRRTK